jgi:predicted deacylase
MLEERRQYLLHLHWLAAVKTKTLCKPIWNFAAAFGAPLTWVLGAYNDSRSLNAAALDAGVPMIAAELGGGGGTDPEQVAQAMLGIKRCLALAGIIHEALAGSAGVPSCGNAIQC